MRLSGPMLITFIFLTLGIGLLNENEPTNQLNKTLILFSNTSKITNSQAKKQKPKT